jgi:hypothetical protein
MRRLSVWRQTQPPRRWLEDFAQVAERALAALALAIKEIGRRLERGIGVEVIRSFGLSRSPAAEPAAAKEEDTA